MRDITRRMIYRMRPPGGLYMSIVIAKIGPSIQDAISL